jgi:hypothetical protein
MQRQVTVNVIPDTKVRLAKDLLVQMLALDTEAVKVQKMLDTVSVTVVSAVLTVPTVSAQKEMIL